MVMALRSCIVRPLHRNHGSRPPKRKPKCRAPTGRRIQPDLAAVLLNDFPHQGQPDAFTWRLPIRQPSEESEHLVVGVLWNAGARVTNEESPFAVFVEPNRNEPLRTRTHVLDGIVE